MRLLILSVLTSQLPAYIPVIPTASGKVFSNYHRYMQQILEMYQPKEKNEVGGEE